MALPAGLRSNHRRNSFQIISREFAVERCCVAAWLMLETEDKVDLAKSQDAWKDYIQYWCDADTASSKGGSIRPLEIAYCQEALTSARAKELGAH